MDGDLSNDRQTHNHRNLRGTKSGVKALEEVVTLTLSPEQLVSSIRFNALIPKRRKSKILEQRQHLLLNYSFEMNTDVLLCY